MRTAHPFPRSRRMSKLADEGQLSLLGGPPVAPAGRDLGFLVRLDGRLWKVVYNGGGGLGWWGANAGWLDRSERLAFLTAPADAKVGSGFDAPAVILRLEGAAVWTSAAP